jgi:hypothetical protein
MQKDSQPTIPANSRAWLTSPTLGFVPKSPFQGFDFPHQILLPIGDAENIDKGEAPKDGISGEKITHLKTSNLIPTRALIYRE